MEEVVKSILPGDKLDSGIDWPVSTLINLSFLREGSSNRNESDFGDVQLRPSHAPHFINGKGGQVHGV